jgi:hypothetical protein
MFLTYLVCFKVISDDWFSMSFSLVRQKKLPDKNVKNNEGSTGLPPLTFDQPPLKRFCNPKPRPRPPLPRPKPIPLPGYKGSAV